MDTEIYYNFLKEYINNNESCFIGSHDSHEKGNPEKIIENGLRVSYSPYSKRGRYFKDEYGNFNLDNDFMATMVVVNKNNIEKRHSFLKSPAYPVVVNIPKELLEIISEKPTNEEAHRFFCGYAFEEFPESGHGCGKLTHLPDKKGANVRVLPTYLIAGQYDVELEKFIENNKHFSRLPKDEQNNIIKSLKEKYDALTSQNQPQ